MSITKLARLARVSDAHISKYERGRYRASTATMLKVAAALGATVPAIALSKSMILEDPFIRETVEILRAAPPAARAEIVKRLIILAGLTGVIEASSTAFSFETKGAQ
jgi:transcriptional regulator with XRE-family HTH domain